MAKKSLKALSTAALAAAFTTSAIVPAAVASAETPAEATLEISHYVVEIDGKAVQISAADFVEMKAAGKIEGSAVKFVKANDVVYTLADFTAAKASLAGSNPTQEDVLKVLAETEGAAQDVELYEAAIGEDGTISAGDKVAAPAEELLKAAQEAVAALPTVEEVKVEDKAAVEAAAAKVAAAKEAGADVTELQAKVDALVEKIAKLEATPSIESVKAVNDTNVKVTFDKAITEEIALTDVVVTEKASGDKVYIKSVKLAEDKKSLDVVFYDTLKNQKTYDFAIKIGENALKASLDFVVGEPAQIQLAAQTVKKGDALEYKVLDANGLDITADVTVAVNSDKQDKFTVEKGKVVVNLDSNTTAFVELSFTKKDGTVVKSERVTVKAEDAKPVAFADHWTLSTSSTEPDYKAEDYKQDKTLNMGSTKYLDVNLVDQFGKEIAESNVKYETLDASVAIVDENTGKVTPRKEGKALVRASIMDGDKVVATKTFELNVVGEAKLAGIEVNAATIDVTKGFTNKVKVTLVDQFGNPIEGNVKVEVADKTIATVEGAETQTATAGKLTLTANGLKKGTTTVKLTAGDFSKTVSINVLEAGAVADYKVEGFMSELLVKDLDSTDAKEDEMTLKVKSVDANGLTIDELTTSEFTVAVKDADDKPVTVTDNVISVSELVSAKGPFKVTIKVGSLTVFSGEFKVTDNRVAPKYTVKSNKVTVSSDATSALNGLFDTNVLDFGDKNDAVNVTDVDFVSANEAVIKDTDVKGGAQGVTATTQDGKTSIYVDTVTVATTDGEFVLDLGGLKVDVTVDAAAKADLAAAKQALTDAITVAQNKHKDATEGPNQGEYEPGSKATLQAAINAATAVRDNAESTKAQLDQAKTDLEAAVTTFEAGKVTTP
ncbi:hypothetical protein CD798_15915 [Bacillaceae bacterium SAOS 7]|nr:hypothetical protein CD798_15915 [Bacillaceae bacterium SAOS 7]